MLGRIFFEEGILTIYLRMKKNSNFDKGSPIREKAAKICLERYGSENWMQSEAGKQETASRVQKEWVQAKSRASVEEPYSFEETKALLLENSYWKSLLGKAKNRTLLKENPKLYNSIYYYTGVLEEKMKESGRYASSYNFSHRLMFIVERDGNVESLKCSCGKSYSWTGHCRHCSELKDTFNRLSEQDREKRLNKQRVSFGLRNLREKIVPAYDSKAIPIIEAFAKEHGWQMQHAENGGEICIEKLGYWVDAYDKENNVVLEIDEPQHFNISTLSGRDQKRQKAIEEQLGCRFYRIYFNQRTQRVVLYHTPESREWDYQKGIDLSKPAGKNKNGTRQYIQYGI